MIIDFHAHVFPDTLAPRAIPILAEKARLVPYHDGTVSGLVGMMDKCGIDLSTALSIATKPTQENSVNTFAISLKGNPRLIPFGSVFPGSETWESQLERLSEAGIKGIKLHPEYQGFYLDCDEALRVYKKCGELGLIVEFHAGEDDGCPPPMHTGASRINRVCDKAPDTTFVAAHFGGYNMWDDTANNLEAHGNLYLDTSMTQTRNVLPIETALRIIEKIGEDRILFASDSPWESQSDSIHGIERLGLSEEVKEKIFFKNAANLLGLNI